jgi:hypothetical protein
MAVIGALVLIVLALTARSFFGDDDEGGSGSKQDGDGGGLPVIACTSDLRSLCDALEADGVIAEDPPALDLSEASQPPTEIDAWITWNPAPQIANFDAGSTAVWSTPAVLGSATQAVLTDPTTRAGLPADCSTTPTYECLAGAAPGASIGVGEPATSEGIARLAPFALALAPEGDYNQLDADALDDLVLSPPGGQADATAMAAQLTTQIGSVSMVAGPNDLLLAQTETPRGTQRELLVLSPKPATRLVVVITERVGRSGAADDVICGSDGEETLAPVLVELGIQPCEGKADDALAGFLYQVQKKVG